MSTPIVSRLEQVEAVADAAAEVQNGLGSEALFGKAVGGNVPLPGRVESVLWRDHALTGYFHCLPLLPAGIVGLLIGRRS